MARGRARGVGQPVERARVRARGAGARGGRARGRGAARRGAIRATSSSPRAGPRRTTSRCAARSRGERGRPRDEPPRAPVGGARRRGARAGRAARASAGCASLPDGTRRPGGSRARARRGGRAPRRAAGGERGDGGLAAGRARRSRMAHRAGARVHVDAVQSFGRSDDVARGRRHAQPRGPQDARPQVDRRAPHAAGPRRRAGARSAAARSAGVRPGTVDPVAAAGLAVAARHALASPARWAARRPAARRARGRPARRSRRARASTAPRASRAPHVTSVAFPGWTRPELVAALDLEGVAASGGSACSAGTAEPSAVLVAMGDAEAATSTIRFSLGEETTAEDVDAGPRGGRAGPRPRGSRASSTALRSARQCPTRGRRLRQSAPTSPLNGIQRTRVCVSVPWCE